MLDEGKIPAGGMYFESDGELAAKFSEAGFGFPAGGQVLFHPLEVGYLVKLKKSKLEHRTLPQFISYQKKKDKLFPFAFEVYCTVRKTGRQVRPFAGGIQYLRAYAPGVGRNEERPSQLICCLPGEPSAKSLGQHIKVAHQSRLDMVIACGKPKEIRFYKVSAFNF